MKLNKCITCGKQPTGCIISTYDFELIAIIKCEKPCKKQLHKELSIVTETLNFQYYIDALLALTNKWNEANPEGIKNG